MAQNPDAPTFAITETDKILKCVSALGNQLTLSQSIGQRAKSQFDGLSSDQFVKWMRTVDNIYLKVDRDGKMTLWAAVQLLRGSALGYYHEIALSLGSWDHLKQLMQTQYHHLDDPDTAKQRIMTLKQRPNEHIPQYTERLKILAKQAYKDKITESNVKETVTKAFINGILDRRLQESIAKKRPRSLTEAIAMDQTKLQTELSLYTNHSKAEPMDCSAILETKTG